MMIPMSDREASILLGATLMHWGVPFRQAARRALTDQQQATVDAASEKLIALRAANQRLRVQDAQDVQLTENEIALLIEVVEDCLSECGNDSTELSLQLRTSEREEVETLVKGLRLSLQP